MFALHRAVASAIPRAAGRRFASSTKSDAPPTMGNAAIWLGDPGAYPIMIILVGAVGGCCAYMGHHFFTCSDVRMERTKRQQLIRTWAK